MSSPGRWSMLQRNAGSADIMSAVGNLEAGEKIARILLLRYGVVFKRLLEREGLVLPWRELLRVYHRLEARAEIRGGRFVAGISGEQFAPAEAAALARSMRPAPAIANPI